MEKIKTLLGLTFMLLGVYMAGSQSKATLDWMKVYGGPRDQVPLNVYLDYKNDIIIGGTFQTAGGYKWGLIEMNIDGDSLYGFTLTYDGKSSSLQELIPTMDSGWVFVGHIPGPEPYTGNSDIAIIKLDKEYDLFFWDRIGATDRSEGVSCITELTNGYFVIAGFEYFQETGHDVVLHFLTPMGGVINRLQYILTFDADLCWDICHTAGGGFAFTGSVQDEFDYKDAFVFNVNAGTDSLWYHTFGHNNNLNETGRRIRQTSDGGFIVAGEKGLLDKDFYVFNTDANGFKNWDHRMGGTYHEIAYSAIETLDGGFAACGNFWDYTWKSLVVRYDQLGDTLWTLQWGSDDESLNATDMLQLPDSSFIVVGTINTGNDNKKDIFIARIVENLSPDDTHSDLASYQKTQLRLFPNPAKEKVYIYMSSEHHCMATIQLIDNYGRNMKELSAFVIHQGDNQLEVDVSDLESGIYHCRISVGHNQQQVLKVVVK